MLQKENELEVSRILIIWYNVNKRDLPWRETVDPYIIWISEIILQQTRVAQGMDYFLRFTERFPDVASLAAAEEDEVLKYWQGLGYYSRARNLHAAARTIVEHLDGEFPKNYKEILSLKGIGEYTAAAIVSFVWDLPYPVVDGNVYRVLSRLFAIDTPIDSTKGKKQFAELAGLLMDTLQAGLHNQAIMEFGALQCVPQNPDCEDCPLHYKCMAYALKSVQSYPVKQHKVKTRNRYFNYFHIIHNGNTWLSRRGEKDIWEGLYEFPLIETDHSMDLIELLRTESFGRLFDDFEELDLAVELADVKHVLSHQVLYATFYSVTIKKVTKGLQSYFPVTFERIEKYPVSRLMQIYLEKLV